MNDSSPIVVLDACVSYPAALRSLFMWMAVHDLLRPKWTERIHEEWMRSVLLNHSDLSKRDVERIRHLMDAHAGDCLVGEYEHRMEGITLPDSDDVHVLAAAIEKPGSRRKL